MVGLSCRSMAMSSSMRAAVGSNSLVLLTVNSPAWRNPKKPMQQAAQSITISPSEACSIYYTLTVQRTAGVMGRQEREGVLGMRLTPLRTYVLENWHRSRDEGVTFAHSDAEESDC